MNNIANMKWHGLYLTVAAFMLITLPIKGVSEHCREDTWNQALNFQKQVESWYNKKASKFNRYSLTNIVSRKNRLTKTNYEIALMSDLELALDRH